MALTGGEYDLLVALVERANRVLTRDMLLDLLRGRQAGPFDRAIDVAISRSRRKLEDDGRNAQLIKTVRGRTCTGGDGRAGVRLHSWPRSLAARTALVLIAGLVVVQIAGLTIHALDRVDALRLGPDAEIAVKIISVYRTATNGSPERREAVLDLISIMPQASPPNWRVIHQPPSYWHELPLGQRLLRINLNLVPLMGGTLARAAHPG